MGNKKHRTSIAVDGPCRESSARTKFRVKESKKRFKQLLKLAMEDVLPYDSKEEIIGKAYMHVMYAKREHMYAKQQDKVESKMKKVTNL